MPARNKAVASKRQKSRPGAWSKDIALMLANLEQSQPPPAANITNFCTCCKRQDIAAKLHVSDPGLPNRHQGTCYICLGTAMGLLNSKTRLIPILVRRLDSEVKPLVKLHDLLCLPNAKWPASFRTFMRGSSIKGQFYVNMRLVAVWMMHYHVRWALGLIHRPLSQLMTHCDLSMSQLIDDHRRAVRKDGKGRKGTLKKKRHRSR